MDGNVFDAVTKALASAAPRRAVALSFGALAGLLGGSGTDAKKKRKKKKKKLPINVSGCKRQLEPCANTPCCTTMRCEVAPGCESDGPYCCGTAGFPCGSRCDCCTGLGCHERQGNICGNCGQPEDACAWDADCCAQSSTCGDNGCVAADVCVQGLDSPCTDGCDCAADLFCSERDADTCQICGLPQESCGTGNDCCLAASTCGDNGCEAQPNQVCCQGAGAFCFDSCDCCADFVCDPYVEECVPVGSLERTGDAALGAMASQRDPRGTRKARWSRRQGAIPRSTAPRAAPARR